MNVGFRRKVRGGLEISQPASPLSVRRGLEDDRVGIAVWIDEIEYIDDFVDRLDLGHRKSEVCETLLLRPGVVDSQNERDALGAGRLGLFEQLEPKAAEVELDDPFHRHRMRSAELEGGLIPGDCLLNIGHGHTCDYVVHLHAAILKAPHPSRAGLLSPSRASKGPSRAKTKVP